MIYRTLEIPVFSSSQYPQNLAQDDIAKFLHLMYVATRAYPIHLRVAIDSIPVGEVSDVLRRRIFALYGIAWEHRADFVSLFDDYIIPAGEKGGLNFAPHLFCEQCKDFSNTENKEDGTVFFRGKKFMAIMRQRGLLPIRFPNVTPSRKASSQTLGKVAWSLKSHNSQDKITIARKHDALTVPLYEPALRGKKISLTDYAMSLDGKYKMLFDLVEQQQWIGHLLRKFRGKSVPQHVNEVFSTHCVNWQEMAIHSKYRTTLLWPDHAAYSPNIESDKKPYFDTTGSYHSIVSVTYSERKLNINVCMDNQTYKIVTGMTNKVLGFQVNPDMSVSYYENNRRRLRRTGTIKQLRFFNTSSIQLTLEINPIYANNTENPKDVQALLSTSRDATNEKELKKAIARSGSITEGLVVMGIDINAYPSFAHHIYRLSFHDRSDIETTLPNGCAVYLHEIASGRCGEKTPNYEQFQGLIRKLNAIKEKLDEITPKDGTEKTQQFVREGNEKLCVIRKEMASVSKLSLNLLSADAYKYLDLIDTYISTVTALETKGVSDVAKRKEISLSICPKLKSRRAGIRRNYTNRILYEITGLCYQHNVSIVAMEDLENGRKGDADDEWNRRTRLLRMEGMAKLTENRLDEIGVKVVSVNASYTSKTYLDKHWGQRVKGAFTPYVAGVCLPVIDDDTNAARNIALRAINRHENVFSITVRKTDKGIVLGDRIGKRLKGSLLTQFGTLRFPIPQTITFPGKYARLYWFEGEWIKERPADIIERRLAATAREHVGSVTPTV